MLFKLRLQMLILVLGSGCLFYSGPIRADDARIPSDHGFMLIRIILERPERVGILSMSNVDTNSLITIRSASFKQVGIDAWIALVAMPHGHYYWSEFQSTRGQVFMRDAPDSVSKTIEIVPGVVNYVGDWKMRISSLVGPVAMEMTQTIEFGDSTPERFHAKYPEYANKYEIYVSEVGKKAIPLNELANAKNEQPERN